jgi:hypothetical protein
VGRHDIVRDALLSNPLNNGSVANPSPTDFAPKPGSPALRNGTNVLAPAVDYFNNPRTPGSVDRGAIQVTK